LARLWFDKKECDAKSQVHAGAGLDDRRHRCGSGSGGSSKWFGNDDDREARGDRPLGHEYAVQAHAEPTPELAAQLSAYGFADHVWCAGRRSRSERGLLGQDPT